MRGGATSDHASEKDTGTNFPCRKPTPNTVGTSLIRVKKRQPYRNGKSGMAGKGNEGFSSSQCFLCTLGTLEVLN